MKTFDRSLIILLLTTPMICAAQVTPQKSPSVVASEFYTLIVKEDTSGLPDVREMQLLRPYLSRSLFLFGRVRNEEVEAVKRTPPQEKPPLLEGCLFSCLYEGPNQFRIGRQRVSGRFAYLTIEQSAGPDKWADTLILVKEKERWRVWDVRLGCDRPHAGQPTLRMMLGDT
jgi:hypothetical protein